MSHVSFYTLFPVIQQYIFSVFGNLGIEFKKSFCGFEQSFSAQHEFVMMDPLKALLGLAFLMAC